MADDDRRMSRRHRTAQPESPAPITTDSAPWHPRSGDTLCGYRVVRKLGDGPRADVFLGFSQRTADGADPATAAIKIFKPSVAGPSIVAELEALARAAHPHVVRFADVATTPSGSPCVVMERLARGTLAHLLEQRPTLEAGEAVTILAPIAVAVTAMHESGVLHGAIGASTVLFRDSGAPVIARFGHARLIESNQSPATLAREGAADNADLAALARLVLARVPSVATDIPDPALDRFGQALADWLFELAEPAPVRFAADSRSPGSAVPGRTQAGPALPVEVARGWRGRAVQIAGSAAAQARQVRRPVWVVAASVIFALVAAIALVPGEQPETATQPVPTETPFAQQATAVVGDDPVAALAELIAGRNGCVSQLSVLCLDSVSQAGSQAYEADAAMLRAVQSGAEIPDGAIITPGQITVIERLGDSVLLSLGRSAKSKPASALIIRGEAGWRIRDYLN